MKRNLFLATVAAVSFAALPAMAQVSPYRNSRFDHVRPRVAVPTVNSYTPHTVLAGGTVTINGENFISGSKVMLNGALITPFHVRSTRISFKVPAGATDGTLSVIVPNRRRALSVGSLDITLPAPPPRKIGRGYYDTGWAKTRRSRRAKSRQGIMSRWNRMFLASPEVKAELRLHAKRLAKLNRMSRLAKVNGNRGFALRIKRLIKRENARHAKKMTTLASNFQIKRHYRASLY